MQILPIPQTSNTDSTNHGILMLPTIQVNVKLAKLTVAQDYRDQTSLRKFDSNTNTFKPYPILSTPESTFGNYGIGLELYFFFLRHMSFLFLIISILSIYPIYSNYSGGEFGSANQNERYTYLTLANQAGINPYETDLQAATSKLSEIQSNLTTQWAIDFSISIIFFIFICYYIIRSRYKVLKDVGEHFKISDFAIQIEGFPPMITKEQVIDYFSEYGDIEEVYLSRDYEGKLPIYKRIFEAAYEIEVDNIAKRRNFGRCESLNHDIKDETITLDKTHDELFVDKAFVVFNSLNSKKKCMKDYAGKISGYRCCRKNHNHTLRRMARFRLSVQSAPNPSDIIWENMEISYFSLVRRRAVVLFVAGMIIVAAFILVFAVKGYFRGSVTGLNCNGEDIMGHVSVDEAKDLYTNGTQISCYCQQQSFDTLISNQDYKSFCQNYLNSLTASSMLKLSISLFIVIISSVLKVIIEYLSKFEKYKGKTERRKKLLVMMFILAFFNTAITTLLVNERMSEQYSQLKGKYSEITRAWYGDVGSTITVMMIINIFSQHAFQVLLIYPYSILVRKCCHKRYKSQLKLNKFFRGPSFNISESLSQVLVVISTNYCYSAGMPFLNILCFFTLVLTYICNKFLILRYYRTPPEYTQEINESLFLYLPFPIIIHSVFSIFAFGSTEIFPNSISKPADSEFVVLDTVDMWDKIVRTSGLSAVFLILVLVVFTVFLKFKRGEFYERFWNYKVYAENDLNNTQFRDLKNGKKLTGLDTYDIYKNPKYMNLIKALDSVAKKRARAEKEDAELESRRNSRYQAYKGNGSVANEESFTPPRNSSNSNDVKESQSFFLSDNRNIVTDRGMVYTL